MRLSLFLAVLYAQSVGPVMYCFGCGWLADERHAAFVGEVYRPLFWACGRWPALDNWDAAWENQWHALAIEHNEAASD